MESKAKIAGINECPYCKRTFKFNSTLTKHLRVHTKEKPFQCNFENCLQGFSQLSNLLRHKRTHEGIKPFKCRICSRNFTSKSNLTQHISTHEKQESRVKFFCFIKGCQRNFFYLSTLKKHVRGSHTKIYRELKKKYETFKNFNELYFNLKNGKFVHELIEFNEESSLSKNPCINDNKEMTNKAVFLNSFRNCSNTQDSLRNNNIRTECKIEENLIELINFFREFINLNIQNPSFNLEEHIKEFSIILELIAENQRI